MDKNKRRIITIIMILGILILTIGITYALYNYSKLGSNQQLLAGDIYMNFKETNEISMSNVIPTQTYSEENCFEFQISGKNTYSKKDIWYEIVLSHGKDHDTRTTRIKDRLLKFTLIEKEGDKETVIFDGRSYYEINNTKIWVNTIKANTLSEINKTYKLYIWIDYQTVIGNVDYADYDLDTWENDVYASVKVSVNGDFNEKTITDSLGFYMTSDDTNKEYKNGDIANNYVKITFKTYEAMSKAQIYDTSDNLINQCDLESIEDYYTCSILVNESGNYNIKGIRANGELTDSKEIEITLDNLAPTFNIYNGNVLLTNNQVVDFEKNNSTVTLTADIKDIIDNESGIKSLKYSFVKNGEAESYEEITNITSNLQIKKEVNSIGIYNLIVKMEDNAGNISTKSISYRVFEVLDSSDLNSYIVNLEFNEVEYDGTNKEPAVELKTSTQTLVLGQDYTVSYSNNVNAGEAKVTITAIGLYSGVIERTFTIKKVTPTVSLSSDSGSVYAGDTINFTATSNVAGTYDTSIAVSNFATVSPVKISNAQANSVNNISVNGVSAGSTTISVKFTPTNSNYETVTKTFVVVVSFIEYKVIHQQMANDGSSYVVVLEETKYGSLGEVVTPEVKEYANFISPSTKSLTLTKNIASNVITYQYVRECYGVTCEYCNVDGKLGECLYNKADEFGLYTSGLEADTNNQTKRVIGTKTNEPDNFVCFGTTTDCTNTNNLHRIVSVTSTDHRVEIIYPQSMGTTYWLSSTYTGETDPFAYDESYVKKKVDAILTSSTYGYATNINSTTKWSDIIAETEKNSFGNTSVHTLEANTILRKEEVISGNNKKYTSKLHLISLSDLMMSTGSTELLFSTDYETIATSWMFLGANEWTYHVFNTGRAYLIGGTDTNAGKLCSNSNSGYQSYCSLSGYFSSSTKHNYRVSFDLNKDTLFCGGSGTSDDPIILGYGSCE